MLKLLGLLFVLTGAPVLPSVQVWAHPANARLARAMQASGYSAVSVRIVPAIVHEAVVFPQVRATTWTAGARCAGGPFSPRDVGVALPAKALLGRRVLIRSRRTGVIVEAPVIDVGPWSTKNDFVDDRCRPLSERGLSDRYRRARHDAGIDLTPGCWKALQHGWVDPRTYSDDVDLIVIVAEVPRATPVSRTD